MTNCRTAEQTNDELQNKGTEEVQMNEEKFDLEERLIAFAVRVIRLTESLPKTPAGRHIVVQMTRSGTSPAANYGEAQDAESRADFVHKLKIVLKELRETRVWLLMIQRAELVKPITKLESLIQEANELISIFVKSVKTARKNKKRTGEQTNNEPQNFEQQNSRTIEQ